MAEKLLEMQALLEKSLSTADTTKLVSIGVNQSSQWPQDIIKSYSQGSQTQVLMSHDVATETRKITFDSNIQCTSDHIEMYTQTEIPFKKNKHIQTDNIYLNNYSQTCKLKLINAAVQTTAKLYIDKSVQALNTYRKDHKDVSMETKNNYSVKGTCTESIINCNVNNFESNINQNSEIGNEKSDSPPLSLDKTTNEAPNQFSFQFVSLFNPIAVRLPNIGTCNLLSSL